MHRFEINLNGTWEILFDPENTGAGEGRAFEEETLYPRAIDVPSTWNLLEPEYEGVAFYRRKFTLPSECRGKTVRLRFGAVNYFAEARLNGIPLGTHEGGYTPFEFDISGVVRFDGENTLTVRVIDPPNDGSGRAIDGLRHMEIPSGKESWYVNFSGIWQEVKLIVTDAVFIEDVYTVPDPRRGFIQVRMTVRSDTDHEGAVAFMVTSAGTPNCAKHDSGTPDGASKLAWQSRPISIDRGFNLISLDIPLAGYTLWSLEHPVLYLLDSNITTRDGLADGVTVRFGMRTFELRHTFFYLNGKRIILQGVLHQQQYPKNLAYPESKEEARRMVRLLRKGGWNLIRAHIRPPAPEFLDVCDEEGMLVFEEPAIGWIVEGDRLRERALTEVRDMVMRDRNHPSVVMWGILNESGVRGAPDILGRTKMYWNKSGAGIQKHKDELAQTIRGLDPTRFITDDSGAVTCTCYPPESEEPESYYDNHLYMAYPLSHAGFEVFRNLGQSEEFFRSPRFEGFPLTYRIAGGNPGRLFFQSEFGCGGLPVWPEVLARFSDGSGVEYRDRAVYRRIDSLLRDHFRSALKDIFPSYRETLLETQRVQAAAVRRMIEALRANTLCAGYVLTQLHDNDYECNAGILNPFFQPKLAYRAALEANRPLRVVLETHERTVYPGGEFTADVWVVNNSGKTGPAELVLTVTGPDGAAVRENQCGVQLSEGIQTVCSEVIRGIEQEGAYLTRAELFMDEHPLDAAEYMNYVIPPKPRGPGVKASPGLWEFTLIEFEGKVRDHLMNIGVPFTSEDSGSFVIEPIENERFLADPRLPRVLERVREGAEALFLGLPLICLSDEDERLQELRDRGKYVCWCSPTELETDLFGFPIVYFDSKPRFVGPYHYFRRHHVFETLDPGHILDDRFAKILPFTSVRICGARILGGVFGTPVGYHFKIRGCEHALDLRWGADLCVKDYGLGRLIFSTYRIADNLGTDPVADRLLWNLLRGV